MHPAMASIIINAHIRDLQREMRPTPSKHRLERLARLRKSR
jgi:hypothetical protein